MTTPTPDAWRIENNDASSLYNFLDSTNFQPVEGSQFVESAEGNVVVETLDLIKKDATIGNVRSEVVALETLLEQGVRWHRDTTERDPVWYRWVTQGEDAKRSLIYNYQLRHLQHDIMNPNLNGNAALMQLALTRHRAFEEVTAVTASVENLSLFGGVWDISGDIAGGILDGRISKLTLTTNPFGQIVDSIWLGLRPIRDGVDTFTPLIDLSGSSVSGAYNSTATVIADAGTASSGAITTWNGGTANWEDYIGRYTVLARYKYTNTSTRHSIKMSYSLGSYEAGESAAQYPRDEYSKWHLVPLGEIEIIPGRQHDDFYSDFSPEFFSIELAVERVEGSGSIQIDALCLVPAEHNFSVVTGYTNPIASYNDNPLAIYTHPDDTSETYILNTVASKIQYKIPASPVRWQYPASGAMLVCFTDRNLPFDHVMTHQADIEIEVYRRWPTYRA